MRIPIIVVHAAQASHAKFYPLGPFASVTIAQWAIESGWGQFVSGKNNYFGIKATHEQIAAGDATSRWTHETFNGVYHPVQQWFANYDSIDDCFIAHARLLSTSQYYWKARKATTPDDYAMALQGIYATGIPGHPYGEVLIGVMKSNNLYAFDEIPSPGGATRQQGATPVTDPTPAPAPVPAPPPPVLQATHAPTVSGPISIDWGSFVSQLLSHETPIIETVAQAGVSLVLHEIPLGSFIEGFITPKVVKQYVDMALVAVQGGLEGQSIPLPSTGIAGNIAAVAENLFRQGEPELVSFLGGTVGKWITDAVGELGLPISA